MKIISDPAKSGAEDGALIDGYEPEQRQNTLALRKIKSPLFFPCSLS